MDDAARRRRLDHHDAGEDSRSGRMRDVVHETQETPFRRTGFAGARAALENGRLQPRAGTDAGSLPPRALMTGPSKPVAIVAAEAPARTKPSNYPEPFASRMAGREKRPL